MARIIDLRITGTPDEIERFLKKFREQNDVVKESEFYKNRGNGNEGRVYVEVYVPDEN